MGVAAAARVNSSWGRIGEGATRRPRAAAAPRTLRPCMAAAAGDTSSGGRRCGGTWGSSRGCGRRWGRQQSSTGVWAGAPCQHASRIAGSARRGAGPEVPVPVLNPRGYVPARPAPWSPQRDSALLGQRGAAHRPQGATPPPPPPSRPAEVEGHLGHVHLLCVLLLAPWGRSSSQAPTLTGICAWRSGWAPVFKTAFRRQPTAAACPPVLPALHIGPYQRIVAMQGLC